MAYTGIYLLAVEISCYAIWHSAANLYSDYMSPVQITREPRPVKGLVFLTERKDVFLVPYGVYNALPMFAQ